MSPSRTPLGQQEDDSWQVAAFVAAMLVFSPLIKGGNVPVPLLILELLSLVLLARLVFVPAFWSKFSRWGVFVLAAAVLLPLLYLIPVPISVWEGLPGRAQYADLIRIAQDGGALSGMRAISLQPFESEQGWYALLFPVSVFLVMLGLAEARVRMLIAVFLGMAVFQAMLGLIQFIQGTESLLRLGNPYYLESAVGTYVNRANLAGLLYLALPISIALLAVPFVERAGGESHKRGSPADTLLRMAIGLLPIILLVGLVFTRSRAGIALGLLGLLLTALMFSLKLGKRKLLAIVGAIFLVGLFLALMTGIAPVVERFAAHDAVDDQRWDIFSAALQAAQTFSPIGAGPATFAEVFPLFQPGDMIGFVNRVHNDYLELYFNGGLLLLIPALLLVLLYLVHWKNVWGGGEWHPFQLFQAAAGVSVLLMLLHSMLDFNLHIPANAGYFAFLAGIFLRRESPRSARRNHSRKIDSSLKAAAPPARPIPEENLVNPFASGDASPD